jgi:hypothetical protein
MVQAQALQSPYLSLLELDTALKIGSTPPVRYLKRLL